MDRGRGDRYWRGGHRGGRGPPRGLKRGRDEPEPMDKGLQILHSIMHVCERGKDGGQADWDKEVEDVAKMLRRHMNDLGHVVRQAILDCAVEIPTKTTVYATLVGLLNAENHEFAASIVEQASDDFNRALVDGETVRARLLLRFFTALMVANVLQPSAVISIYDLLLDTARNVASAAAEGDDGRTWQPWTDYLVYIVVIALPWGGVDLMENAAAELAHVIANIDNYMTLRCYSFQPALCPCPGGIGDNDYSSDALVKSDSGGAAWLTELWEAVKQLRDNNWATESIPFLHTQFEATLAAGQPHDLPHIHVPASWSAQQREGQTHAESAATLASRFTPRGNLRLIAREHTEQDRLPIERFIAEEYILDTIHYWHAERIDCAKRLASQLPVNYAVELLLAETLFAQMLKLPSPWLRPLAYSVLITDLCKIMPMFPRGIGSCVKTLFGHVAVLDIELRDRFAEWMAYHLSNTTFYWPWDKWKHVLTASADDPQRRFCVTLLGRLIRLSYWDRIKSIIPEEFHELLPPQPEILPLSGLSPPPAAAAEGEGERSEVEASAHETVAAEIVKRIREKDTGESLRQWLQTHVLDGQQLPDADAVIRAIVHAALFAGSKTLAHTVTALERVSEVLLHFVEQVGVDGEMAAVDITLTVWEKSSQRAAMAVQQMMTMRVCSAAAVTRSLLSCARMSAAAHNENLSNLVFEILINTVNTLQARLQDAREDGKAAEQRLRDAERSVETMAIDERPSDDATDTAAATTTEGASAMDTEATQGISIEIGMELQDARAQFEARSKATDAARQELHDILVLIVQLLADTLEQDEGPSTTDDNADAPEPASAAFRECLYARLKEICRRYYEHMATILPVLDSNLAQRSNARILDTVKAAIQF